MASVSVKDSIDRNWLFCRLRDLPGEIAIAERDLLKLTEALEEAKKQLLDKEMELVLKGLNGKNEMERKACLRYATLEEQEKVRKAEGDLEAYKIYYHQKLNEFSALKAIARALATEVN